jgi:hypothetical protein
MKSPRQFTPVRPRTGGLTHATTLDAPRKTACNRPCDGWVVVSGRLQGRRVVSPVLTCEDCKDAILGIGAEAGVHAACGKRRRS